LTATTGGGTDVSIGGSETSLRLSLEISMEAVLMLNTCCWLWSPGLRGLDRRLLGLSDLSCSDLRLTGDMEPVSRRPERLAGEAERPLMSRVRLETRALVSDWAEFCRVSPDTGSSAHALAPRLGE